MKTITTLLNYFETKVILMFFCLFITLSAFSQALVSDAESAVVTKDFSGSVFFTTDEDPWTAFDRIPTDVNHPEGVYYMVQVGAYKTPISAELYPSFGPLVGNALPDGTVRYLVGYFREYADALSARNQMIKMQGYEKSFVVAYRSGNYVSLGLAWKCQKRERNSVFEEVALQVNTDVKEIQGLRYYVQLGTFSYDVPQSFANAVISASEHTMITESSRSDLTEFRSEDVKSYAAALQLLDLFTQEGILNAHIVPVYQGFEISLSDAAQLRSGQSVKLPEAMSNLENNEGFALDIPHHELRKAYLGR
jgi:hypothetical protein